MKQKQNLDRSHLQNVIKMYTRYIIIYNYPFSETDAFVY